MPGMSGPANVRTVRECYPNTRVVIVSGSASRGDILAALAVSVHGYVPKGLGVADLTAAISTVLSGTIYVPPALADVRPVDRDVNATVQTALLRQPDTASPLTVRQRNVLELIVRGKSNKAIARTLEICERIVKVHLAALFRKLGVSNRTSAAAVGTKLLSEFRPLAASSLRRATAVVGPRDEQGVERGLAASDGPGAWCTG